MTTQIKNWTSEHLPDLSGRLYVITGGNSGIGFEAAKVLAGRNANLMIASRDANKAAAAVAGLIELGSGEKTSVSLDLADLSSVRHAATTILAKTVSIDGLINNAGIMQTPKAQTADGFELQLGTNHLGHFLFTALLLDAVEAANGRVVTVSSVAHRYGRMHFDDLMLSARYDPTVAYCQSKLANLVFAQELHRRLSTAGRAVSSMACHPGYSDTSLQSTGPGPILTSVYKVTNALFAQSAAKGAIPTVLAAAGEEAVSGGYYGPTGFREFLGPVGDASIAYRARKPADAARLWSLSEKLVGHEWLG